MERGELGKLGSLALDLSMGKGESRRPGFGSYVVVKAIGHQQVSLALIAHWGWAQFGLTWPTWFKSEY